MYFFQSFVALSLVALATIRSVSASPVSCVLLQPGNYTMTSVSLAGEKLGVGSPTGVGNIIVMEKAPPQGQLGVWTLTSADQGGYHLKNVELDRNVSTLHLQESNLFLAQVALSGADATTYAIECAGNSEYVIKSVDADQLWTTIPGTGLGDPEEGVANIELLPASGSTTQHFLFQQV